MSIPRFLCFSFLSYLLPFLSSVLLVGIAVWHLVVARHSQVDDQRPPVTRIYGSISPQLII